MLVRNLNRMHSVNVNVKVKVLSEIPRRFASLGMTRIALLFRYVFGT